MHIKTDQVNNQVNLTGIILAGGRSARFGFKKLEVRIEKVPLFIDQIFKLSLFCREILFITSMKNRSILNRELDKIGFYRKFYEASAFNIPDISVIEDEDISVEEYEQNKKSMIKKSPDNPGRISRGPIMGIYTGLKNAANIYSLVLAFDMPFISYKILSLLVSTFNYWNGKCYQSGNTNTKKGLYDAVIIKTAKGYETLCGLYSRSCASVLKESIDEGNYKILDVFERLNIKIISNKFLLKNGADNLNFFNINNIHDYYKSVDIWNSSSSGFDFTERWKNFFYR